MREEAHAVNAMPPAHKVPLEEEDAAGLLPKAALHVGPGAEAKAEAPANDLVTSDEHDLPPFMTAYRGLFYLGLPNVHGGIDSGVGSGRVVMNWYKDLSAAGRGVYPKWQEFGASVKYLKFQTTRTWSAIDKSADQQMDQLALLNKKSNQKLKEQLAVYLGAEKDVSAARADMARATKLAAAAAHDFNSATAAKDAEDASQQADKKAGEIKTMSDDRALMVKQVTALLGIATNLGDVAVAPASAGAAGVWSVAKLGVNVITKIVENVEGPEYTAAIERLTEELAELRVKVNDNRLSAANEKAKAASEQFQAAQANVVAARNRLSAAKARAGAAVTELHAIESQVGGTGLFRRIDETSADMSDQVGTDLTSVPKKGAKPGAEVAKTPAETFGEGTLRAVAAELLAVFGSGPFARAPELRKRLADDKQAVDGRFDRRPQTDASRRWTAVWNDVAVYVNWYFTNELDRMVASIAEVLREVNQGEHLHSRHATLAKIATQLGVVAE